MRALCQLFFLGLSFLLIYHVAEAQTVLTVQGTLICTAGNPPQLSLNYTITNAVGKAIGITLQRVDRKGNVQQTRTISAGTVSDDPQIQTVDLGPGLPGQRYRAVIEAGPLGGTSNNETTDIVECNRSALPVFGNFDLSFRMIPENTDAEAVEFIFDMESNLVLTTTLSGLSFGADLGFGITGPEFAILTLEASLGALQVHDDFVFAVPFGCTLFPTGVSNSSGGIVGDCDGRFVFPIGDGDGDGVFDNAVGFVKKRVEMELNIAGFTLTNVALFEDVDFPDIRGINPNTGLNDHEHDHFGRGALYDLSEADSFVDNQSPTFGFGDVISISGQSVSGITVTAQLDICADSTHTNYIKKRNWPYEVNEACTASLGNTLTTPIADGTKAPLLFERRSLSFEGVQLGGVTLDVFISSVPLRPISVDLFASFSVLDLADVRTTMRSENITELSISQVNITITSEILELSFFDFGGDLDVDLFTATLSLVLNANHNPTDLAITAINVNGVGLVRYQVSLGIQRGNLRLDSTTRFSNFTATATGTSMSWTSTTIGLSMESGSTVVTASTSFTVNGIGDTSVSLGWAF